MGGALRIEAARILGYHYDPNFVNVNSTDPNYAAVDGGDPGRTQRQRALDGLERHPPRRWIGYSRKIYRNVNWRIQLNLQSIGEKDHLFASSIEPDGTLGFARIQEGMGWRLENSFDF